ncbi:MAG: MlaE family lipid ABC transporter permease subunit [Mariprofundales bacterium]
MNLVLQLFGKLGRNLLIFINHLGDAALLSADSLKHLFIRPWQGKHIVEQLYVVGVGSLIIIVITGAFTGMVLALQGFYTLSKFGSTSMLGSAVALSIIRELGPVLAGLMLTARAGSSITAEIGIMRVTEQLDALEMMAVNPRARILMPRIIACTLALPLLVGLFDLIGIGAGYVVGVELLGVNPGNYIAEMQSSVATHDLNTGWVKAVSFGFLIGVVCTYLGFRAEATTEGVGRATTQAVVFSSMGILILDYILTSFFL